METKKIILKLTLSVLFVLVLANHSHAAAGKTITFKAKDDLTITADLYAPHPNDVLFIILLHQARSSRGEYIEIAPKLNKMGFNCMAVDLRSGGRMNEITNLTHRQAVKLKKYAEYRDSIADIKAAIIYAKAKYPKAKLSLWGSSYSAGLAIKFAGDSPKLIDAVLAFSPAEYFKKSSKYVKVSARNVICPVFITSAQNEEKFWRPIFNIIPSKHKHYFLPKTKGNHGSSALWKEFDDSKQYWKAVTNFLKKYFPQKKTAKPAKGTKKGTAD